MSNVLINRKIVLTDRGVSGIDIKFTGTGTVNLTNTAQVFTATAGGGTTTKGLDTKKLPAGISGRVWFKVLNNTDHDMAMGFSTTNAVPSVAFIGNNWLAGAAVFGGSPNPIARLRDSNSADYPLDTVTPGMCYGIWRNGSSGVLQLQKSLTPTVETSWQMISQFTATSTADLFIIASMSGDSFNKIAYPQGINIV